MIRKLRLKLIMVIMGALLLIFGAVITTLNLTAYYDSVRQTQNFIDMITENDGFLMQQRRPPDFSDRYGNINFDDMRARRFFYVKMDRRGNIIDADYSMMFDFPKAEAEAYIFDALKSNKSNGQVGYFYYGAAEKSYGKIIVFSERRVEIDMLAHLTNSSLVVAGISCVFLLLFSFLLSKWMVAPIKAAFEKQRRFISDANHELKTPLTIISANVDVLQREIGENARFGNIRVQLARMNKLIGHLLTLSKTEDTAAGDSYARFDLSKAMLSAALEFESCAFEEGKEYEYEIGEHIFYTGNEEKLKSLLSILIDNAIKHAGKGSKIKVALKMEAGRPRLSVYNTGFGIPDAEKDKIFDRFYRSDASRARERGGYGLGLSIAKAIADAHKGKIRINGEQGKWVEFVVIL
jgi:signal transduction histidine kinase